MFKALLLPNHISEQSQYFRNASNFAKYWKNNIIYIVTFKGHGLPKFIVSSSCYKFSKILKHRHVFFRVSCRSYLNELLLINLSLTSENFIAKYQKVCEIKRFTHEWVTEVTKVPHFSSFFISCQVWPKISHKPFDILRIWIKFQENWSRCLDHFLRIDMEWPFRDRKSRFIVLFVVFSATTCEPLKVCRQVKHCTKGSRQIFQIGLTASYVCTWNFWENPIFCFVSCLFGNVFDDV